MGILPCLSLCLPSSAVPVSQSCHLKIVENQRLFQPVYNYKIAFGNQKGVACFTPQWSSKVWTCQSVLRFSYFSLCHLYGFHVLMTHSSTWMISLTPSPQKSLMQKSFSGRTAHLMSSSTSLLATEYTCLAYMYVKCHCIKAAPFCFTRYLISLKGFY